LPDIYASYSDAELLQLLSGNNNDAFEMIYSRYWEELYTSAYYLLRDPDASKDIVQEIFIWLWEKRHSVQIVSLKPYLKAAVKFKVANFIRSGKIRTSFYDEIADYHDDTSSPTPEELAETNELARIMQTAIQHLPDKCREIYILKREERMSSSEIAQRLNLSVKTVENQITIAQKKIRCSLDLYLLAILLSSATPHADLFF
jgi:RNA polymerase sigma-70 factor (family 1)